MARTVEVGSAVTGLVHRVVLRPDETSLGDFKARLGALAGVAPDEQILLAPLEREAAVAQPPQQPVCARTHPVE